MEPTRPASPPPRGAATLRLVALAALVVWALWWIDAVAGLRLRFTEATQIRFPAFGADFWTQVELAARSHAAGRDPYVHFDGRHLVHYPPIVVRLFLWVVPLSQAAALRIWILALAALVIVGAVLAHRQRFRLGAGALPLPVALAVVLWGFPVLFELERANFDLVALAAILAAHPLLERRTPATDALGGALLAVAPWVKIYPGLLGVALLAQRRARAFAAFVIAGLAIGLAAPSETLRSLLVLHRAATIVAGVALEAPGYWPWVHSLSLAWTEAVASTPLAKVSGTLVALAVVAPLVGFVVASVVRAGSPPSLTYPLILWVVAAASYVPLIANDYSLVFLGLAAVAVWSARDPWWVHAGWLAGAVWWQPFALPVGGWVLLPLKVVALAAVGASLAARATDVSAGRVSRPSSGP